ncbi:SDR family NAD(P)-dependent oxidoreductase [Streptomyces europaeiscabiei]|nr:SDR family NAD(P)-dependent oxidoreductase [Streptomyces europaeiscabiei]
MAARCRCRGVGIRLFLRAVRRIPDRVGEISEQAGVRVQLPMAEPIAIVGMSCRFPGGIESPQDYWDLLKEGRHFSSALPADRGWNLNRLYDEDSSVEGTTYVRRGGFLEDAAGFDAAFFGIGPKEATAMDPQQRLLLEGVWHALENARIAPRSLEGSRTGVYVGIFDSNYIRSDGTTDTSGLESHLSTSLAPSVAAGRVSYVLGLNGPAMAVDTACSSSLVATHLAIKALRAGECDAAVAAGVSVMAGPEMLIYMARVGALADDGLSRAFAEGRRGFAPAEGVGALVLMPLARAVAEGRPVLALLRGSAVNEDGASQALSVPDGAAQQALIAEALRDAGLRPQDVDLVEAHGTGTQVGDPIEASSLAATYGVGRRPQDPVWIGSAKSNIGHTQAAAGMAGIIKAVLALRHERMPATLHAQEPLTSVDWSQGMHLLHEARPWPRGERTRRAGVLAYGIGGTNAHVLVEEAPAVPEDGPRPPAGAPRRLLWPVYAESADGLRDVSRSLASAVRAQRADPADVGFSLAMTRSPLAERAVITGSDVTELLDGLDALAEGRDALPAHVARAQAAAKGSGPVFVFPGQGAQWAGMAAGLLRESPVFAEEFERCCQVLEAWVDFDVADVVRRSPGAPSLERADVVQPVLFAVYVALARLWQAHGVRPAAVIGHSQGEIAAAYVCGALSLEDAARVVALRSAALREIRGLGTMASVALPAERVQDLVGSTGLDVEVAACNGPAATTVAGDPGAIRRMLDHCEREGIWARPVPVDYASHSRHVDLVREVVLADLGDVVSRAPEIPMISTTTGKPVGAGELDATYWYGNLRRAVLFDTAVRAALDDGHRTFVEVSPHPVLLGPLRDLLADAGLQGQACASLRRGHGDTADFHDALAGAHARGVDIDWSMLYPDARTVGLPGYPFQHDRFWLSRADHAPDLASAGLDRVEHRWLGAALNLPDGSVVRTGRLALAEHPWLADHAVHGTVLLPATGVVELLTQASDGADGARGLVDAVLHAPLVLGEEPVDIQTHTTAPDAEGRQHLTLYARPRGSTGEWTRCAEAATGELPAPPAVTAPWPPAEAEPHDLTDCYRDLRDQGYEYGSAFRNLVAVWRGASGTVHAEVRLPRDQDPAGFALHPALLDAALHALVMTGTGATTRLPHAMAGVRVFTRGARVLRATMTVTEHGAVDLTATDDAGTPVVRIQDLRLRRVSTRHLRALLAAADRAAYRASWRPYEADRAAEPAPVTWAAVSTATDLPVTDTYGTHPDMAALSASGAVPGAVVLDCRGPGEKLADGAGLARETRERLHILLTHLQAFLRHEPWAGTRLLILTCRAESTTFAEPVLDLAGAACAGLARSAVNEFPGRVQLLDTDHGGVTTDLVHTVLAAPHRTLAARDGRLLLPRLVTAHDDEALRLPADDLPWRLVPSPQGTLEAVRPVPVPELAAPVAPGKLRIRIVATGANFRDTMVALGLIQDSHLGFESAGVVTETGAGVSGWRPGDRVALLPARILEFEGAYGPLADMLPSQVVRVPDGVPLVRAAGSRIVHATAHLGLIVQAGLRAGDKVLIHSAAGGVGMAAVRLAQQRGAEIYATAGPAKQAIVRDMGVPRHRIANSRTTDFETAFRAATGGTGVDVVIGSVTGELLDASLRLLRPGGRYLDMARQEGRVTEGIAARFPEIGYGYVDLPGLLAAGEYDPPVPFDDPAMMALPVQRWSIRHVRQALRALSQGQTTGKIVLTQPAPLDPGRTVLITGGTGALGGLLARHLAGPHGVRHLLLLSRSGAAAPGAEELRRDLEAQGAEVTIAACDAADLDALREVIRAIPQDRPLGAVVHTAGALADALLTDLTPRHLDEVLRAKTDAVLNLHELTRDLELDAFVVYSSLAGTIGNPGQANYAAANAFLDAFAHHRRHQGLPGISIAWGLWEETSGLTAELSREQRARLARLGLAPTTTRQALAGFDAALDLDLPYLAVTAQATAGEHRLPEVFSDAFAHRRRPTATAAADAAPSRELDTEALRDRPATDRIATLTRLVRTHAAAVLGHASFENVSAEQTLRNAGFDSLATVELRTRLGNATGLRVAATAPMDHPTPAALARYLDTLVTGAAPVVRDDAFLDEVAASVRASDRRQTLRVLHGAADRRRLALGAAELDSVRWERLNAGAGTEAEAEAEAGTGAGAEAEAPTMLLLPPIPTAPGTSPYERLVRQLDTGHTLLTVGLPGYAADPLPADLPTVLEALVRALPKPDPRRPYLLLGHCTGGTLAAVLAEALEKHGHPVSGLILLDSPRHMASVPESFFTDFEQAVTDPAVRGSITTEHLTALAAYHRMLDQAPPGDPAVPTLCLHPEDSPFASEWPAEVTFRSLPGGHGSPVDEHAADAAAAISAWLEHTGRDADA